MDLSQDTIDLLNLLTKAVIADMVIKDVEIEAFVTAASSLSLTDIHGQALTPDMLRDWFNRHHNELYQVYFGSDGNMEMTRLVMRMQDRPDKDAILKALGIISETDGNFHMNEKVLISLIDAYWK